MMSGPYADKPVKKLSVYAAELREWLQLSRQFHANRLITQSMMLQLAVNPALYSRDTNRNLPPNNTAQAAAATRPVAFPANAGTECKIPAIWKRVVAELIDCLILLVIKFIISFLLINVGGFNAIQILDFDYAVLNGELDLEKIFHVSSDILLVEIIHRIFVSCYEAYCLSYIVGQPVGGATPGKRFMKLAVVACDEVFTIGQQRFIITDIRNASFYSSLMRSLVKNFSVTLLVPTCFTAYLFDHRRTIYDIISGTVVIEAF